jgi:hypothetical protein
MEIRNKEFPLRAEPSAQLEADLAIINRDFALAPLTPEQIYVRRMALCNDRYDRTGERFPVSYLERFRDTLAGKALLISHDRKGLPIGRFFRAEVLPGAENDHWLVTHVYLVRTEANAELRTQIDAGILAHVSIGFRWADLVCDLCGCSYFRGDCPHLIGQNYDGRECTATYGGDPRRVEAVEASLVFLGAQYGSVITKSDDRAVEKAALAPQSPPAGEGTRNTERTDTDRIGPVRTGTGADGEGGAASIAEKGGEGVETSEKGAVTADAGAMAEAQAAAPEGERRTLDAAEMEALRALAADGRLYREDLRAEVVRLAGCVGATREALFLCEALENQPAARWKELRDEYQTRFEALFPPTGLGQLPEQAGEARRPTGVRREFGVI